MFARFDENPAMTLQDIKKTLRTDGRTHTRTHNVKTVYPPQTKFAGGIMSEKLFTVNLIINKNNLSHDVASGSYITPCNKSIYDQWFTEFGYAMS